MVSFDEKNKFAIDRTQMIHDHLMARDITDPAVLSVMGQIPREEFIPQKYTSQAYTDQPLPIGTGQTISQPYIVALMTQHLRLNRQCRVLEIGTGSGYQTAILAKLAKKAYTIERYSQLSEAAQTVLARLKIENVEYYIGDGSLGWPQQEQAIKPFDRIIITAAIPQLPLPLDEQLSDGGLLVAPVGGGFSQDLVVYEKKQNQLFHKIICGCRFVKLIGEYGFPDVED